MREFSGMTLGRILEELRSEGVTQMSRSSFYRREKDLELPQPERVEHIINGKRRKGWRYYTKEQVAIIKKRIKQYYGIA